MLSQSLPSRTNHFVLPVVHITVAAVVVISPGDEMKTSYADIVEDFRRVGTDNNFKPWEIPQFIYIEEEEFSSSLSPSPFCLH